MDDAGKTVGRAWGGASERGRLRGAERRWAVAAPALLALLVLAVLGDLVLVGDGKIASHRIGDAVRSFVAQRDFGFSELRAGNLPLWNPHQFSGTPFVGTFQSAMFYPPNLVHLVLPVAAGINFEVGLHLLVLGLGTMAWARGRGLSPPAALIAAVVASFGATVSLRVLAGALSVLATYAWAPLLLRCVDELARRATLGWTLVAASAATMTLLAGHLPTAFMTALALALYCVPALFSSPRRLRFVGCLAGAAALALLLAGAQLGAGFDLARESVREGGMSFGFSTAFSFPPENLLNSVVASLFGDATPNKVRYFGRGWYWDDSVFIGAAAFSLALIGACSSRVPGRKTALVLAGCLVLLALGRHTPLYGALYRAVPGFDLFRAPSKFMFYASLFVALLVGMGAQRLLAEDPRDGAPDPPLPRRAFALGLGLLGALLLAIALWSAATIARDPMAWTPVHALAALNESPGYDAERALEHWGAMAAESATWAGASFVAVALLVWGSRARRWLAWLVLLVCVLELVFFARANRGGIASRYPLLVHARALNVYRLAEQQRVFEVGESVNFAMAKRGYSIWGYEPVVLGRYADFMARTQGRSRGDLDNVSGDPPDVYHPLLAMLRAEYSPHFEIGVERPRVRRWPGALPRFVLVGRYRVVSGSASILDALDREDFDPRALAVLEAEPDPAPKGGPVEGDVRVLEESTDHMVLEVEVDAPALLIVTDSYSEGWRATPLPGSVQQHYEVLPANLVVRAIALEAGRHRLRLEYRPAAYLVGLAASALGALLYAGLLVAWLWRRRSS